MKKKQEKFYDSIKIEDQNEIDKLYEATAKYISSKGMKSVIIKLIKDDYAYFVDNGLIFYKSKIIDNEYFSHNEQKFELKNFIKCRGGD